VYSPSRLQCRDTIGKDISLSKEGASEMSGMGQSIRTKGFRSV
jgi:hypothetical protein